MNRLSVELPYDVAIIGGGPGGSTVGALLKRYAPDRRVLILEREQFPRDHVGESQLPPISAILDEMGCWDQVEAANFPIKIGATFRWGQSSELWDFDFLSSETFRNEPRPARFEGQRRQTAFQVDRAVYDDILLRHAASLGCEVRQGMPVLTVDHQEDRVTGLRLGDGSLVTARHYIDASGHAGVLRRALGVAVDCPTRLKNIAIWDYWENARWAEVIGVGGTRVQVMSLGHGWLWFIPLGPTRASLGLVCPLTYYKQAARPPEELYLEAIAHEPRIGALLAEGRRRGRVQTTTDWSFVAERTAGANWFLVGESAGFADPILAAGLTLTHTGARELAYTLLELSRGEHDPDWLKRHYDANQRARIRQHIRFADFWYAANGQFTDLQEQCREIAREAGLTLSAADAWRWLAQGGFTNDVLGQAGIGGLDLAGIKQITQQFTNEPIGWQASDCNRFTLRLDGASRQTLPHYHGGRIRPVTCYFRDSHRLAVTGLYELLIRILHRTSDLQAILQDLVPVLQAQLPAAHVSLGFVHAIQALEVMVSEGWVRAELDPRRPRLELTTPRVGALIHPHHDHHDPHDPGPSTPPRPGP